MKNILKSIIKFRFLNCLIVFFSLNQTIISQEKIETGTYLTENKLEYIFILKDNIFGFTSYINDSPYTHSQEHQKIASCGTNLFEINEKGFGNYEFKNNKLKLIFEKPENPLDSIILKELSENKSDSIFVNFIIKTYLHKEIENQVLGVTIKSEDNQIELNTGFENEVSIKLSTNQLPIKFIINENNQLIIEKNIDYNVLLYFNEIKMINTKYSENKSFEFNKLIKIEND